MRKRNSETVTEVLHQVFHRNKALLLNMAKYRVRKAWYKVMTKDITEATLDLFFKKQVLYVHLSSAPLRMDLLYRKEEIRLKLNEYAGQEVIEDIIFS